MTLVVDKFRTLIPPRAKSSPSGWTSFNAPCCGHRGHSPDTRKRGGLRFDNGIVFNCFNCKFTASWQPGRPITNKFKNLCKWLGASEDDIKELVFEALKTEAPDYVPSVQEIKVEFTTERSIVVMAPISTSSSSITFPTCLIFSYDPSACSIYPNPSEPITAPE